MRILIVEDDYIVADGLKFSLEYEGYSVSIATNTESCYEEIKKCNYDLIIIDIMLPDGNGLELCREIKSKINIPIIFVTAKDTEEDIIKGLNIGADDYIIKPFRIRELIARIQNAIRKYKRENIIEINNVIFDIDRRVIIKNNQEITLTTLEWEILITLLNANGKVVTRDRLLDISYNKKGNIINDNSLTVYIKRLRQKIEDDINNPSIIKTIKGVGYKI